MIEETNVSRQMFKVTNKNDPIYFCLSFGAACRCIDWHNALKEEIKRLESVVEDKKRQIREMSHPND